MLHRLVEPAQDTAIFYTERLAEAEIAASVDSVGSSYDNGPNRDDQRAVQDRAEQAPSTVAHLRPRRDHHGRLYEYCGDIPPAELETAYYAHQRAQPTAELTDQ